MCSREQLFGNMKRKKKAKDNEIYNLNVDGSRRFSSGHIGASGVLRDHNGDWLGEPSANLGKRDIWVTHPGSALTSFSLNFGVLTKHEAIELPKGFVLGRDGNIHLRITLIGNVGCHN
ncbi:unnamed protein product [Malus baccata var. baccata]